MDYLLEALKFIDRSRKATNPDVVRTDLEMARWFLSQDWEKRDLLVTGIVNQIGPWGDFTMFRLCQWRLTN
jgi:hypothetical protein